MKSNESKLMTAAQYEESLRKLNLVVYSSARK